MYGNSDTPLSIRIANTFYNRIPSTVTETLSPLYFRYQSRRADISNVFRPVDKVDQLEDAPNHILLLVIDALRPDYVPDVPISFTYGIAPSTWTFPSVTSLHTGVYPHEHGAVAHTKPDDDEFAMPQQVVDRPTLPDRLEAAGYNTYSGCAFIVPFCAIKGWYQTHQLYGHGDGEEVISDYLSWRRGKDKTFGYLHLGDLHGPIDPPTKYLESRGIDWPAYPEEPCDAFDGCPDCLGYKNKRIARYEAGFDYVNDYLNKLVPAIENDTLLIITGDHGEGHGEHYEYANQITDSRPTGGAGCRGNVGHGGTPFDVTARVPIGISHPHDRTLLPEGGWASLCDIPATVLAEVIADSNFSGQRWQTKIPKERAVLSEAVRFGVERKAVYKEDKKVIRSKADDKTFTALVGRDASGERFCSLSADEQETLLKHMPDYWENFSIGKSVGPVVEGQLEALGYT